MGCADNCLFYTLIKAYAALDLELPEVVAQAGNVDAQPAAWRKETYQCFQDVLDAASCPDDLKTDYKRALDSLNAKRLVASEALHCLVAEANASIHLVYEGYGGAPLEVRSYVPEGMLCGWSRLSRNMHGGRGLCLDELAESTCIMKAALCQDNLALWLDRLVETCFEASI